MEGDEEEDTEDENYEPQVTSNNPTERIMARRLRVQRRVEALRKQKEAQEAAGEDGTVDSEVTKTPVDLQVEKSMSLLEKLIQEGDEYVTNVRVATEAREADRREREGLGKEKLLKELEEEAENAAAMFNEITNKWSGILKYNDPLHINEDIGSQKEKCDELIRQKDAIINDLKEKLRMAEINFAIDQRKQIEDVNSITRRIENQIIIMRKVYRQELQMVEEVILANRKHQVEANNKKWEELFKKRDHEEKANSEQRSEDYWNFVQDMDNLNRDFQELYFGTTVQLENDCDELQQELERIKVEAIMNSEKLDYNYQILKKRETENIIIRSQQKRRINKLQDTINLQKKKNNEYHTQTMQEIEKLTVEVKKLCKNILEIEKQADHIAAVNNMKFKKIWDMNKARADNLLQRILDIDKILYEQQLGLLWKAPEPKADSKSEMNSSTTATSQTSSKLSSKQVQVQLPQQQSKMIDELTVGTVETITNPITDNENNLFYKRALNQVLNLVADKTGFLVEEQLNAILEPYLEYEKTLVKVDNVFAALKIEERSDIDLLFEYFLPYMFCPICSVGPEKIVVVGEDESLMGILEMDPSAYAELTISDSRAKVNEAATAVAEMLKDIAGADHERGGTVIEFGPLSVMLYDDNLKGECRGPDNIQHEVKEIENKVPVPEIHLTHGPCQYHHPLMISSVYVLKALKEFLARCNVQKASMPSMSARLTHKRSTFSRIMVEEDIEGFWEEYTKMFPTEREKLWSNLVDGLKRYHELLKVRKLTSEQVMSLRQQNTELRRIFDNYLDKKDIPYR